MSDQKNTEYNTSRPKERDAKERVSDVALAPPSARDDLSSYQVGKCDASKKCPKAEVRSSTHCIRKAKNKAKKEEFGQYSSDESSDNEYKEETQPGAFGIAGLIADNDPIQEDPPTDDGSNRGVDGDVKDRAMLVEAKLAPELTLAEEINIQQEEDIIVQKKQYQRVLFFAVVFYGLAILGNIIAFVLLFVNPPPAYGRLFYPLRNGFGASVLCLLIATGDIFIPTRPCCHSSIRFEQYAPDDKQLLRDAQIASAAAVGLYVFFFLPINFCLPNLQWLAYTFMTWIFAGTVFAFSRVCLLRRSKETRPKKSKLFGVVLVVFFLGLTGITIWRCLNPVYPDCTVGYADSIGDGECDGDPYATKACGYDGGDCFNSFEDYPGCNVAHPFLVGNGNCDGGAYNTMECGYDGGDCTHENQENYPDCIVPNPSWIGDGNCDGRVYGTLECGFDGGDCLGPGERCHGNGACASEVCNSVTKVCDSVFVPEMYPNCSVVMPNWIGDGECDSGYYASEACGFDGGDCLKLGKPCVLDDECASGFCNEDTKVCYLGILENYPDCVVEYPRRIGDGKCNGGAYNSKECGYDGGDCLHPVSQNLSGSPTLSPNFHIAAVAVLVSFQIVLGPVLFLEQKSHKY